MNNVYLSEADLRVILEALHIADKTEIYAGEPQWLEFSEGGQEIVATRYGYLSEMLYSQTGIAYSAVDTFELIKKEWED